jgi:hypothetical protein
VQKERGFQNRNAKSAKSAKGEVKSADVVNRFKDSLKRSRVEET